ncbi:MAG: 6-phosphogluconolactonase [Gaiellaceae bacterium]
MAEVRVFESADDLGAALADEVLARYAQSEGAFLLGCPGGRSLRSTYRALAASRPELARCVVVMMDEYVPTPEVDAEHSCHGFALREVCGPLGIPVERLWIPDPKDPAAFERRLDESGGIDVFLLASGASDGHVGFLPPGSARAGRTSIVELAESTRRDNVHTYPSFGSFENVPTHGVTVGLATIAASKAVRLVLHGSHKRYAAARVTAVDDFDPSWPATIVHECADAEIWLDREAAGT